MGYCLLTASNGKHNPFMVLVVVAWIILFTRLFQIVHWLGAGFGACSPDRWFYVKKMLSACKSVGKLPHNPFTVLLARVIVYLIVSNRS
jgi:hypothetical protein